MSPIIRIAVLAVAAIAAIAAFFMFRSMSPEAAEPITVPSIELPTLPQKPKEEPKTEVLVINRDLRRGELLTPDVLQWSKWPKKTVNDLYITKDMMPNAMEVYSGLRVRQSFVSYEPVLDAKIVKPGQRGYLAAQLGRGMRAVSIQISPDAASGGFILPDDRVDVLLTHEVEFPDGELTSGQNTHTATVTIIQNARVLAIDQGFNPEGTARIGSIATLELSARAAEVVTLSAELGDLSVTLRALEDAERVGDSVIVKNALLRNYFDPYEGDQASGVLVVRDGVATRIVGGL